MPKAKRAATPTPCPTPPGEMSIVIPGVTNVSTADLRLLAAEFLRLADQVGADDSLKPVKVSVCMHFFCHNGGVGGP